MHILTAGSRTAQWYTLSYELDDRGFKFRRELGIFLFTTVFRPALGSTQPGIQWVPRGSFTGGKVAGA
jgi:hypothetical protein